MSKDDLLLVGGVIVEAVVLLLLVVLLDVDGPIGSLFPRNAGSGGTNATVLLEAAIAMAATRAVISLHRLGVREASAATPDMMRVTAAGEKQAARKMRFEQAGAQGRRACGGLNRYLVESTDQFRY
jgi:hypothetical protein